MNIENDARGLDFDIGPQAAIEPQDSFEGNFMLSFQRHGSIGQLFVVSSGVNWHVIISVCL